MPRQTSKATNPWTELRKSISSREVLPQGGGWLTTIDAASAMDICRQSFGERARMLVDAGKLERFTGRKRDVHGRAMAQVWYRPVK